MLITKVYGTFLQAQSGMLLLSVNEAVSDIQLQVTIKGFEVSYRISKY